MPLSPKIDAVGEAAAFKQKLLPQLAVVKTKELNKFNTPSAEQALRDSALSQNSSFSVNEDTSYWNDLAQAETTTKTSEEMLSFNITGNPLWPKLKNARNLGASFADLRNTLRGRSGHLVDALEGLEVGTPPELMPKTSIAEVFRARQNRPDFVQPPQTAMPQDLSTVSPDFSQPTLAMAPVQMGAPASPSGTMPANYVPDSLLTSPQSTELATAVDSPSSNTTPADYEIAADPVAQTFSNKINKELEKVTRAKKENLSLEDNRALPKENRRFIRGDEIYGDVGREEFAQDLPYFPEGAYDPRSVGIKPPSAKEVPAEKISPSNPRDPINYPTMNAWVKANGIAPQEIANYYQDKRFSARKAGFQRSQNEQKLRESEAWATDAELSTATGTAKQLITSLAAGGIRNTGHLMQLPYTAAGFDARQRVSDRAVTLYDQAFKYDQTGNAEDALTDQENAYLDEPGDRTGVRSRRELLDYATKQENKASFINKLFSPQGAIGKPIQALVNPLLKDIQDDDFAETYKKHQSHFTAAEASFTKAGESNNKLVQSRHYGEAIMNASIGIAGLVADGSDDLLNNPGATFEYLAENIPQLAVGKVSGAALLAINYGYGTDIYAGALTEYKELHGRSPTKSELKTMAAYAISAAAMEQVADKVILNSFSRIPGSTSATNAVLDRLSKTVLGRAATLAAVNPVTRTAAVATKSGISESGTETYQTAVETTLVNPDKDFTDIDGATLFKGGAIGFGVGATLSGAGRAVAEVSNLGRITSDTDLSPELKASTEKIQEIAKEAALTGNVAPLLDESNPETYSPFAAAQALVGAINNESTSEDVRETLRAQLNTIVEAQETKAAQLNTEFEQLEAQLLTETDPSEQKKINLILDSLALQQEDAKTLSEKLSEQRNLLAVNAGSSPEIIDALIEQASATEPSPEQNKAADDIILMMMDNPSAISDSQIKAINAMQDSPLLSKEQSAYLYNFSAAHALVNAFEEMDDVNLAIMEKGREGFKGIQQYEIDIAAAVREGDQPAAEQELSDLKRFLSAQQAKLAGLKKGAQSLLDATQAGARGVAATRWLVRDKTDAAGWIVENTAPLNWEIDRGRVGGWTLYPTTKGKAATEQFLSILEAETAAIDAAVKQHSSALDLKFNSPSETVNSTDNEQTNGEASASVNTEATQEDTDTNNDATNEQAATEERVDQEANRSEESTESNPGEEQQTVDSSASSADAEQGAFDFDNPTERPSTAEETTAKQERLKEQKQQEQNEADKKAAAKQKKAKKTARKNLTPKKDRGLLSAIAAFGGINIDQMAGLGVARSENTRVGSSYVFTKKGWTVDKMLEALTEEGYFTEDKIAAELADALSEALANPEQPYWGSHEIPAWYTEQQAADEEFAQEQQAASTEETTEESGKIVESDSSARVEGNMTSEQFFDPETNFITAYFTQRDPSEDAGSVNPLVLVKDFMSWVYEGDALNLDKLASFTRSKAKPTAAQVAQFVLFRTKHEAWKERIKSNIQDTPTLVRENDENDENPKDYKYEDYAQAFKDDVPENLITAISLAAFLWLSENASGTGINTESVIRKMLNLSEEDFLDPADITRFANVGTRRDMVIQNLGEKVRQALEMTTHKNVPADELQKFELAMGAHALAILQQAGLTKQTAEIALSSSSLAIIAAEAEAEAEAAAEAKANEVAADADADADANQTNKKASRPTISFYVKATRNGTVPIQENEEIVTVSRIGERFLNTLLSVESSTVDPASEPGMFNATKTRIKQLIPKIQKRIASLVSKRPNSIRQDMKRVRSVLSDIGVLQVGGWIDLENGQNWHDAIKIAQESRNEDIERQAQHLKDFEETISENDFYIVPVIWKHQRTGQSSNTINQQTSKMHRHNTALNHWKVVIDPTVDNTLLRNFKLTIAQGMGLKVDKNYINTSLEQLELLMAEPEIQAALEALSAVDSIVELEEKLSEEQENAIIAVTQGIKAEYDGNELKVGGENYHTLDALVNWNAYITAKSLSEPFTTQMMFEVDGVTNGPALSLLMLGLVSSGLGEKFGMFPEKSEHKSHAEYISDPAHDDIYQTIEKTTKAAINTDVEALALRKQLGKLFKLDRNELKTPIQMMFFGASIERAIKSLSNGIAERFYTEIQTIANDTTTTEMEGLAQVNILIDRLNLLLDTANQISYPKTGLKALATVLNNAQMKNIGDTFYDRIGFKIKDAITDQYQDFINRRRKINEAGQAAWARYNAAYIYLYDLAMQAKIADKTIAVDGKNQPLQELTDQDIAGIVAFLKPMEPVMHTPLSKADGDLNAGIRADQSERVSVDTRSATYTQNVRFGQNVPTAYTRTNRQGVAKTVEARGVKQESKDPGVATFILMIHALDSAISTLSIEKMTALNIHDAHGLSVADIEAGANELNKHTYNLIANFSVPNEIVDSLQRSMDAEADLVAIYPGLSTVLNNVEVGRGFNVQTVDTLYLETARKAALNADADKFNYLSTLNLVDQYSFPGGAYEASTQQRDLAKRNKAEVDAQLAAIDAAPTVDEIAQNNNEQDKPVMPEDTPWGVVGTGNSASDPTLVAVLRQRKGFIALKDVIQPLAAALKSYPNSPYQQFQLNLLRVVFKAGYLRDTRIVLVSPDTPLPDSVAKKMKNGTARGLFTVKGGVRTIYVRGPEFQGPGVSSEVILHELAHALTAEVIKAAKSSSTVTPPNVAKAIAELETLRADAKKYMEKSELDLSEFEPAIESIDELIAWGMTSPRFQSEVLAKMPDASKNASTAESKNGLQRFFDKIVSIIFGHQKSDARNGLATLVYNVSVITEQSINNNKADSDSNIELQMEHAAPRTFSTTQVYDALSNHENAETISPIHDNHLRSVLETVVNTVYGVTGELKPAAERAAPATTEDVFINSLNTNSVPFTSALSNELNMTDQEAFVAESTELALRTALNVPNWISVTDRKELHKLRALAKQRITVEMLYGDDFDSASESDKEQARRIYSIIFDATRNDDNGSEFLSQFAAAALTYTPLIKQLALINTPVDTTSFADQTLLGKVNLLFNRIMAKLTSIITKTYPGQAANQAIMQLAVNLATLEEKQKTKARNRKERPENLIDRASTSLSEGVKKGIVATADSKLFKDSGSTVIRAFAGVTSMVVGERTEQYMAQFNKLLDVDSRSRLGLMRELINEITNGRPAMAVMNKFLAIANTHEQTRKRLKEQTAQIIKESFGTELTKKLSESVTAVILRTDITSLVNRYSLAQIEQLIANEDTLNLEIAALEKELAKGQHTKRVIKYYGRSVKDLGYKLATGKNYSHNLHSNAHTMAFLHNTDVVITAENDPKATQAEPLLDYLITLYGLKYTSGKHKKAVSALMRDEANRGKEQNGIDLLMKMHAQMQQESKEKLFDGKASLMIKGYTKETYDPHMKVVAADDFNGKDLEAAGYKKVGDQKIGQDRDDDSGEKSLYKVEQGLTPWVLGIMQNTGLEAKGSKSKGAIIDAIDGTVHEQNQIAIQKITNRKRSKIKAMFETPSSYDPSKQTGPNLLAPLLNDKGKVVNYRYLMQENTKDELFRRENRVDRVIGTMAASIFDKGNVVGLNNNAIDAIKAQYDADYIGNADAYIDVSARSDDPVVRERYRVLPDDAKRYISKVFGRNGMYVRNDMYNITMGYRKLSVGDMFNNSAFAKNTPDNIRGYLGRDFVVTTLVNVLEHIPVGFDKTTGQVKYIGKKAALRAVQTERVWQEIVGMVKDAVVIKNLITLVNNEISNASFLLLRNVGIADIIKGKAIAWRATRDYRAARVRHHKLKTLVENKYYVNQVKTDAEQEMIELEEVMKNNPMAPMINAGMDQTIVEDIDSSEDTYTYKSRLSNWTDDKTSWLSPTVKKAAKIAFVTHDTELYKMLNAATMMSDLTSRYVLMTHLMDRNVNPLSFEEALVDARESFVNYDTPTNSTLQYLNDTGLIWFSKYYLRIQIVILKAIRENPLRAAALSMIDVNTDITNILNSSLLQGSPVNIGAGPLEAFDALNEPIPIKTALAIAR